jgi:NTP pyrophosphatase (non-canonical NTP hydrolase)
MKNTFEELQEKVLIWAENKGILFSENHPKQLMKVLEELGELSGAILKRNRIEEEDSFGDLLVTIIILANQRGVDLNTELGNAYNTIKDRVGKTVDGTFIKN